MEGRKLQLTGGSTYVVSLPKHWVVDSGLKAGDTVFLETEPEGSVMIRPRPMERAHPRRRIFEEKGEERRDHLLRKLIGAYIGGFNYIEIRFRPEMGPFVRRVARDFSRMVIGPEVIEETRNTVVIQDLSDTAELSAEKCLRRMHLTVRAMHEDAIAALRTRDEALARDVAQRDQDVDRLYWMVAKQYNIAHTGGGGMAPDVASKIALHNYRLIAKLFERIGDHAERIARTYPVFAEPPRAEAAEGDGRRPGVGDRDPGQGLHRIADRGHRRREFGGGRPRQAPEAYRRALPARRLEEGGGAARPRGDHRQPRPHRGLCRGHRGDRDRPCGVPSPVISIEVREVPTKGF